MLTAGFRSAKLVKTTPCTVDQAGSARSDLCSAKPSKDFRRIRFEPQQRLAKFVISYNQFGNPSGGHNAEAEAA